LVFRLIIFVLIMKSLINIIKVFFTGLGILILLVSLLFGYRDIPVAELKATYALDPSAFLTVDGMEVHYRDQGYSNDSIPIVLIHGTGASLHTFDAWSNGLQKKYRLITMDLPGFGLTGPFPDRNYSMDHYVKFVEKFLDSMGVSKCIIGGNSLGGAVAWQFSAKNPQMVSKLILIDAAGYPLKSESVPVAFRVARIPVLNKVLTFITPRGMVRSSVENVYADPSKVTEALVDRYFKLTLREGNRQALVDRMSTEGHMDYADMIKGIRHPTLVLWGEKDLLIPVSYAHRFHSDLPNSKLVILESMGHVPMEESPEESLVPVLDFLNVTN
jgi:pimeloyl-ACP methyl ester carboxylesterase